MVRALKKLRAEDTDIHEAVQIRGVVVPPAGAVTVPLLLQVDDAVARNLVTNALLVKPHGA